MKTFQLKNENIPALANLMSTIKPDWWDYQVAMDYLSKTCQADDNISWFIGKSEQDPKGFLICKDFIPYSCLSIENWGFDDNGHFVVGHQMEPLFNAAEEYARSSGRHILRLVISSTDVSCHGKPLGEYWEALRDLSSNSDYYKFYIEYGFKPSGFLPNCYGKESHGVIMVKELV